MKRSEVKQSIDEYLNSTYHSQVAFFPEIVRDNDTDDYLAWKLGHIAIKASHVLLTKNSFGVCYTSTMKLNTMCTFKR